MATTTFKKRPCARICLVCLTLLASCATTNQEVVPVKESPYIACLVPQEEILQIKHDADAGYSYAQVQLATWHQHGPCLKEDLAEAIKWLTKAADQGNIDAINKLANLYHYKLKDTENTIYWYSKAAKLGDIGAANKLGYLYLDGGFIEEDLEEALKWFSIGAVQGESVSASYFSKVSNILGEQNPGRRIEIQRVLNESQKEMKRLALQRKQNAQDRLKTIGILWLPTDPEVLDSRIVRRKSSLDSEGRAYVLAPLVYIGWPVYLLSYAASEAGAVARKSHEQQRENRSSESKKIRKALLDTFNDPSIQEQFRNDLKTAVERELNIQAMLLSETEDWQSNQKSREVDTILGLENMSITAVSHSRGAYRIVAEVEYKLTDYPSLNIIDRQKIVVTGKDVTKRKAFQPALEKVFERLADNIVQSMLDRS